jgi:hypothetical protein
MALTTESVAKSPSTKVKPMSIANKNRPLSTERHIIEVHLNLTALRLPLNNRALQITTIEPLNSQVSGTVTRQNSSTDKTGLNG